MPYYRRRRYGRKKATYRRRTYRRRGSYRSRRYRRRNIATFRRLKGPVTTDSVFVRLIYNAALNQTSDTASAKNLHGFTGNDIVDPDATGGGLQPTGFDQWSALYNRFRVMGSAIEVKVSVRPNSSVNNKKLMLLVFPATFHNTTGVNWRDLAGNKYMSMKSIPGVNSGGTCIIKKYMSTRKIYGLSKTQVSDDNYTGTTAGVQPSKLWYWNTWTGPFDDSNLNIQDATNLEINVKLIYYVKFFDRKTLPLS